MVSEIQIERSEHQEKFVIKLLFDYNNTFVSKIRTIPGIKWSPSMRCRYVADFNKNYILHKLRHCYATHLLESGTDIRYIQAFLGYKHSKTKEIDTHVTTRNIQNIKSPFDDLEL